ncbi:MAG: MATE family efflux transporter [Stellaceae bacterium]
MTDRRTRLLTAPILPTLAWLAGPTVVVLMVQASVGVAETWFVSHLGTESLAGVALVFPALMLMQMMSNGGIGGGVSSAVARALGAGRREDAEALVFHSLVVALGFGLLFTAAEEFGGRALFAFMGGKGGEIAAALHYADVIFAGSILIWLTSLFAAALRGAGNVMVPALVTLGGAVIVIPLSPSLIFGLGPMPRMGVAGAGTAIIVYYAAATLVLGLYLRSGRGLLRLVFDPRQLRWRLLREILSVGGLSAIGTLQMNLTVAIVTGLVGGFGAGAVAGYAIASRVDYILIPLLFGIGTAALTMVGIAMGAGDQARARRIAWISTAVGVLVTEAIGLAVTSFPDAWLGLFSGVPVVLATGARYFHTVAPFYGAVGLGMMLYFAGQGAGRVFWPVVAGTVRLALAGLGGWFVVRQLGLGLPTLFIAVACASLSFGTITAIAALAGPFGPKRARLPLVARPEFDRVRSI